MKQRTLASATTALGALLCALAFAACVQFLKTAPRQTVNVEMQVALPLFVQVALAAGDRYLAADIATIRALVVATDKMRPEDYAVLAKVQTDVSWLNPGHEDNYYIAAAILPWVGQLDAAQTILSRAMAARPFDYQPAFYYAFHRLFLARDARGASAVMRAAAEKLPEGDERLQMQNLAAIWLDKTDDPAYAISIVAAMAKEARRPDFRRYLEQRVDRLRQLQTLREAAARYRQQQGRPLAQVEELVAAGLIEKMPADPFGFGFAIDARGEVVLRNSPPPRSSPPSPR